jgi:hypothetical protein
VVLLLLTAVCAVIPDLVGGEQVGNLAIVSAAMVFVHAAHGRRVMRTGGMMAALVMLGVGSVAFFVVFDDLPGPWLPLGLLAVSIGVLIWRVRVRVREA